MTSPQIVVDDRPHSAKGLICTEYQHTFPWPNDTDWRYPTKHAKPTPCPNPGCRNTFPCHSDYLAQHLFCNSACMTKEMQVPRCPWNGATGKAHPKAGQSSRACWRKLSSWGSNPTTYKRPQLQRGHDALGLIFHKINIVDDTLKPCSWNESGYTCIMIAKFGWLCCSFSVLLSSIYHCLQWTCFLFAYRMFPSCAFLHLILIFQYACSTRPLYLFTLL